MKRIRQNVEILVPRLQQLDFEFGIYPDGEPFPHYQEVHVLPAANITEQINELENIIGCIPLSLRAFWEIVGSVNFISYSREKGSEELDPLFVESIDSVLSEYEEWLENCERYSEEIDSFALSMLWVIN